MEDHEPRLKTSEGRKLRYNVARVGPVKLSEMGVGIGLYFGFVRKMAFLFSFMSFWAIILMGLNVWASNANDTLKKDMWGPEQIARLSMGMMIPFYSKTLDEVTAVFGENDDGTGGVNKADILLYTSIVDACMSILFVVLFVNMGSVASKMAEKVDGKMCTIGDYTILIHGLPVDIHPKKLMAHFESLEVAFRGRNVNTTVGDVVIVKDIKEIIGMQQKRNGLAFQLMNAEAQIAKTSGQMGVRQANGLLSKMKELDEEVTIAWKRGFKSHSAFVTFETELAYYAIGAEYRKYGFWNRSFQPDYLKLKWKGKTYPLSAVRASEPEEICWENMTASPLSQSVRRLLTFLVMVALVVSTTAAIVAANNFQRELPISVDCAASIESGLLPCDDMFPNVMSPTNSSALATEQARIVIMSETADADMCDKFLSDTGTTWVHNMTQYARNGVFKGQNFHRTGDADVCAADTCWSCFCRYYHGIVGFANDDLGANLFCQNFWTDMGKLWSIRALSVGVVVVVNVGLGVLARKLTVFEQHKTRSDMERATARKLFVCLFLNLTVSTLVVYANIPQIQFGIFFDGPEWGSDFTARWYREAGSAITLTMIGQSVFPHIIKMLVLKMHNWKKLAGARTALTQHELNKLYLGPNFDLAETYGRALAYVFSSMLLWTALPILVPLTALYLIFDYNVNKYVLLRGCRTPPPYDENISKMVAYLLPMAAWLHASVGLWVYGSLPSHSANTGLVSKFQAEAGIPLDEIDSLSDQIGIGSRVWKATGMVMLLLWILVTLYILALRPIGNLLKRFAKMAKPEIVEGNPPLSRAIKDGMLYGAYSYNILENIEYAEPMGYFPKEARPFVDREMESLGGVRYVNANASKAAPTHPGAPAVDAAAASSPAQAEAGAEPSSSVQPSKVTKSKAWGNVKAAVNAGGFIAEIKGKAVPKTPGTTGAQIPGAFTYQPPENYEPYPAVGPVEEGEEDALSAQEVVAEEDVEADAE